MQAVLANMIGGFPARNLRVIGVTGTDGKTTTTTLIAQMLRSSGKKVAMLTTVSVDYGDGAGEQPNPSHMTTASVWELLAMFKKIKHSRPDWVVLETSSHALAQHRVFGVNYEVAVLTNVTREHLDYHGTFPAYLRAKRRLFELASRNKKGMRVGVINADDPNAELFTSAVKKPLTYGINSGEMRASDIKLAKDGSTFKVAVEGQPALKIVCRLPGRFNVYNCLAAAAVGQAVGLTSRQIEDGIASLKSVAGRMMRVEAGQPFEVIVDYAVTPAALENALKTLRETTPGTLMIVFGATGDRDRGKRPIMGEIVARLADKIFLTDEESYSEDAGAIRQAVYKGIRAAGGADKCREIDDRGEAIKLALGEAKAGDTVFITGLGHQTDRNMGGKKIPWSDSGIVRSILK